jgi:serine/threonine-protein kinase SRPK3
LSNAVLGLDPVSLVESEPLEEEQNTPHYEPKSFLSAHLGERYSVLNDGYQLTTRLGYGTGSTVWLARDLYQLRFCSWRSKHNFRWYWSPERYFIIKINAANCPEQQMVEN